MRAGYFFFSDLLDCLDNFRSFKKSFNKAHIAVLGYKRLDKFDIPSLNELYEEENIDVIKADLQKYLDNAPCSICMSEMDIINNNNVRKLKCGHSMHINCIRSWIM